MDRDTRNAVERATQRARKLVEEDFAAQLGADFDVHRATRKALLLKHVEGSAERGARFDELAQVLPDASRNDLKVLLRELKHAGELHVRGVTSAARWFRGPERSG